MIAFDRKILAKYLGNMKQLADIRTSVLDNGRGNGMRVADFYNSSGLKFTVLPDKAMDIGYASYKGIPISFLSQTGYSHPAFYEPQGIGWLRNWGGGLLTSCGLNNVGQPKEDDCSTVEGPNGLHGRISNTSAEITETKKEWVNGKYVLSQKGIIRDGCLFGRNIELHREIKTYLGESIIEINDEAVNLTHRKENLELLYHINIGYPFLSEKAILQIGKHQIVPRDKDAEEGMNSWNKFHKPIDDYKEQVFFHNISADNNGVASAILNNPELNLSLKLEYSKESLPNFWQWKMMGSGTYVLGMEPTNVGMDSYGENADTYTILEGYSRKKFSVKISVIENK